MLILYYHNVVNTPLDEFDRKLSRIYVDEFAEQMRQVAAHYRPVSLEAMFEMLQKGEVDPKAVVITFDDGYAGVITYALPILKQLSIPATIFVVMNHVGDAELLHFDELEIAFRLTSIETLDVSFAGERAFRLASAHAKVDMMKRLKKLMKSMPNAERLSAQDELLEKLAVDRSERLAYRNSHEKFWTASWEDLRRAQQDGLAVGSHTCSHPVLSRLARNELEHEIRDAYARLREEISGDFLPFAYPYGTAASIDGDAPALVKEAGYTCALTTLPGKNQSETDPFLLHRVEFESLMWPF